MSIWLFLCCDGFCFDLARSRTNEEPRTGQEKESSMTPHLSLRLEDIRTQKELVQAYVDTLSERNNAITDPEFQPILPDLDLKLAKLTLWLLAAFEATPEIRAVYVPSREAILFPGNGEIVMTAGNGVWDLKMVRMPMDPEDAAPVAAHATCDMAFIDDDLESDAA